MSLVARVLLLALALPFVLAGGDGDCGKGQFGWKSKNCCLPYGGPSNPSSPPSGKSCPNSWSWHNGLGCCAPHQPTDNSPPPQCDNNWDWSGNSFCCNPSPTHSNPTNPSTPSYKPGDRDDDKPNGHKRFSNEKRQFRSRTVAPCPKGLSACPVSSFIGGDYECVDTLVDLGNCGGCATLGEGQDCNAIPGVWNFGCEQSVCKIYTCADGYILSTDGMSCEPL